MGSCGSCYLADDVPWWLLTDDYIDKIGSYIPKEQIEMIMSNSNFVAALPSNPDGTIKNIKFETWKQFILTVWSHKICANCKNHSHDIIYFPCQKCWLVFYCSEKCEQEDVHIHCSECQNSNLPYSKIRDTNKICIWKKKPLPVNFEKSTKINGKNVKWIAELEIDKII